jgi:hypothetical protein
MVFLCLLLSVFSTVEQYEEIAGTILYYLVSNCHIHSFFWQNNIVALHAGGEGWFHSFVQTPSAKAGINIGLILTK